MTKGSIGLNAGAIWNLLSDGQHWSFEALRAKSALTDADLWSAIGWLARENKIEIVENKPLARMLYFNVEIGQEVPRELYQMVAEVLAYVYRLKNQ